jgi:hypothetical protein
MDSNEHFIRFSISSQLAAIELRTYLMDTFWAVLVELFPNS